MSTISSGSGNDSISGTNSNDIILSGSGDDVVDGGSGSDIMEQAENNILIRPRLNYNGAISKSYKQMNER